MEQSLIRAAHYIRTVELFPVYLIVHYTLVAGSLRDRPGSHAYAKHHPICSWAVCVISCFGGSVVLNFLLGNSLLDPFQNEKQLLCATTVWYLMFFSPLDLIASLLRYRVFKALLLALKEIHRTRMIMLGVAAGMKYYPNSMAIVILLGCIKGSGAKFILRPLDQFVRGETICFHELQKPHFSTKASVVLSTLLALMKIKQMSLVTEDTLLVLFVSSVIAFQISFLFGIKDPFERLEKVICYILITLPQDLLKKDDLKQKNE